MHSNQRESPHPAQWAGHPVPPAGQYGPAGLGTAEHADCEGILTGAVAAAIDVLTGLNPRGSRVGPRTSKSAHDIDTVF